jgi:pSer/pThr/pTyr-binding forkhead associated (FHA) protein
MAESRVFLKSVTSNQEFAVVGEVLAGRDEKCGLRLATSDENKPSHKHARLLEAGGELSVEDLGSTNGTFVNGGQLTKGQIRQLKHGDRVSFHLDAYDVRMDGPTDKTIFMPPKTLVAPAPAARPPPAAAVAPAPAETPGAGRPEAQNVPFPWRPPAQDPAKTRIVDQELERRINRAKELRELASKLDGGPDEPHLIVMENDQFGRRIPLHAAEGKTVWTIGREAPNDIILSSPSVSELHARIVVNHEGKWKIEDQTAANGTWVDGSPVTIRYLGSPSVLWFGDVDCVFRMPERGSRWKRSANRSDEAGSSLSWVLRAGIACAIVLIAWVLYRVILG